MAREKRPEEVAANYEKQRLKDEKKQLKKEQKMQRKDAKRRAKEIAKQEEELADDDDGGGLATFGATLLVVALWIAVICVVIKLDVGSIGSSITPILKDVPVVNRILPENSLTETTDKDSYGGYTSIKDAAEQIKNLELELERAQSASKIKDEELDSLKAEVLRLQEFEKMQTEFQRIRTEFYEEVVYAEKGPGVEEYVKYYESIDPANAEHLYKQAIVQMEESQEIQDYAAAYSSMKPKQAAAILEAMTDNLNLAARILSVMSAESRGDILGVMDPDVAAKLTKIMNPES